MLPHQQADFVRHIAIDIGGSLIKLVYFSPEDTQAESGDASEKGRNHAGGETVDLLTTLYGTTLTVWGHLPGYQLICC